NQDYRLQWQTAIDTDVAPDPVVVENVLVSAGRRTGSALHIEALRLDTGTMLWRYAAERFVASVVAVYENRPVLWQVSGDAANVAAAVLYRIDIRTGERKRVADWQAARRIEQAWIAYAAGRVFIATASPDLSAKTLQVHIDCFDAATGKHYWHTAQDSPKATLPELLSPVTLFSAQKDLLSFAMGSKRWTVRAENGAALPSPAGVLESEHSWRIVDDAVAEEFDPKTGKVFAKHAILWRPSTFRIQNNRLYAFTADGLAYAMNP